MNGEPRHVFEFDEFRIEAEDRRLLRNDSPVTVTSRDFDILLALVERAGQTVDKNDLMEIVWENTFVEEGNLNRHVSTLRKVLGDDPRQQRLIKTVPKRGYRFTANVRETIQNQETLSVENISRRRLVIREETSEGFWTTPRFALACIGVICVSMIGWLTLRGTSIPESSNPTAVQAASRSAAMDVYRQGRALWQTRRADDLHNATVLLEQARDTDPQYALAHAALADAYAFDYANRKKAEPEALEAIRLDPSLGEPHATLGFVKMFWGWKVAEAEDDFKKAVNLSPGYATGRQWYALNLAAAGRGDAAIVEIEKALTLDPDSISINVDYCRLLYFANDHQAATTQCKKALTLEPGSRDARELLYRIYSTRKMYNDAVATFVELVSTDPDDTIRAAAERLRRSYDRGSIEDFRRAQIAFYTSSDASAFYRLARVHCESGNVEAAVSTLTDAIVARDFEMIFFAADPAFEAVRHDSRRFDLAGRPR